MRLIDKLIIKDLVGPFINGLAMFTLLVFAIAFLPQAMDLLLQGVRIAIVLKLVLLSLPEVLTQTLPMALLLAGLLGFGRISGDSEAVAIFAAGISFPRAARTVMIAGVLVSIAAFFWNDDVVPPCKQALWDIKKTATSHLLKSDRPLDYQIRNNDNSIDKYVTVQGGYDARTLTLRHVNIIQYSHDPTQLGRTEAELYCDHAVARDPKAFNDWTYYDGYLTYYQENKTTGRIENISLVYFDVLQSSPQTPSIGHSFEEVLGSEINDPSAKNFHDLHQEIKKDRQNGHYVDARGKEVNLYGKIALPLAGAIFGVLGAALGCNTQRGGNKTVGFGLAVFIAFLYYVFYRATWVIGQNGGLPPILASFLADIVGAVVGLYLAIRASR